MERLQDEIVKRKAERDRSIEDIRRLWKMTGGKWE